MTLRRRITSQQSASHGRGPARPTRIAAAVLVAALIGTVFGATPAKAALEPAVVSTSPTNGSAKKSADAAVLTSTYDRAVKDPNDAAPTSSFVLKDNTNTLVAGADARDADNDQVLMFTPAEALTESGSPYTATVVAHPELAGDPLTHSFTFTIDNTPPGAVTITAPVAGSLVKDEPVHVMGNADPGSTIKVSENGTDLATGAASGAGAFDVAVTLGNDDGVTRTLEVRQVDAAGNAGPSASRSFIHDNVAPAAPAITSPSADILTSSTEVTLSGTSADGTVQIRDNGVQVATTEANGGTWSHTVTGLADGAHPFRVRSVDEAGNVSALSNTRTVTVDATAPMQPTVDYTPKPVNSLNQAAFMVFGGAEDDSDIDITISDQSPGTADLTASTTADDDGDYGAAFNLTPLDDGTLTITVTSTDAAENERSTSITAMLDTTALPPTVAITPDPINAATDDAVTVEGAGEPGGTATITVSSSGGGSPVSATAPIAADGSYARQFDVTSLGNGTITASVTQQDAVGNGSTAGSDTASKDAAIPGAPVVNVPSQDQVHNTTTIPVVGTAEASATVSVRENGLLKGTATSDAGGNWSMTIVVSGDGYHTIKATQTDTVGNAGTAEATRRFIVNIELPTLVDTNPDDAALVTAAPVVTATYSEELSDGTLVLRNKNNTLVAGTKTVSGDAVTFTPSGTLSDAGSPYTAQTTGTDLAGAGSGPSFFTFSVDGTAPAAPAITAPAQNATLTTSDVTITGTAEANSTVEVVEGTDSLGTTTASGAGAWSLTRGFSNGSHTITATAEDAAGNVSPASAARTFSVDADAPDAPVIAVPAENALLANASVSIGGTAEPSSTVSVRENGVQVATATTGAGGNWSTSATFADGPHTITARATDGVGHVSVDSAARSFTVDTTDPAKPVITSPAGDPTLGSTTVSFSGTAEPGSAVRVFEGGTLRAGPVTADGSGLWSASGTFSEGAHTVTATATDPAGNASAASDPATFSVDTTAPGLPVIQQPVENATLTTFNVTVSGTAEAGSVVTVREGAAVVGTANASGAGAWSLPATFTNGAHTIRATAKDGAGNESAPTAPRTFTVNVDTTAPAAPVITQPAENASLSSSSVVITGTAEPGSTVRVREGGTLVATATAGSGGGWAAAATFSAGAHTINANATDAAGNAGAASADRHFTITPDTTAPAKPVITAPAEGSENGQTVHITGTAEPGATVRVREAGSTLATVSVTAAGDWETDLVMSSGAHTIVAIAVDGANNLSVPSDARSFTVDATRPSVSFTTDDGAIFLPTDTVTIAGTATDNTKVASVLLVYRNLSGAKVAEQSAALDPAAGGASVTWSHVPELGPGYFTVTAYAVDGKGLRSAAAAISFISLSL